MMTLGVHKERRNLHRPSADRGLQWYLSCRDGFLLVSEKGEELGRVPLDDVLGVIATAPGVSFSRSVIDSLIAARHIPYAAHVSATVLKTHAGDYVQACRLTGVSFESEDDEISTPIENWPTFSIEGDYADRTPVSGVPRQAARCSCLGVLVERIASLQDSVIFARMPLRRTFEHLPIDVRAVGSSAKRGSLAICRICSRFASLSAWAGVGRTA